MPAKFIFLFLNDFPFPFLIILFYLKTYVTFLFRHFYVYPSSFWTYLSITFLCITFLLGLLFLFSIFQPSILSMYFHIFWEGHKILQNLHRRFALSKVVFFGLCSKMQIIPIKKLNIKKVVPQFLWFFRLKCWLKGQIISRI